MSVEYDVVDLVTARAFLGEFSSRQLAQLARILWPAADLGHAGPYSLLVLDLIDDELAERARKAA